jgi:hypothetical protein
MEDVASVAHAAIVKRDWGALQPLLHPCLHWVQADGQVVRGRTMVIGMLQAIWHMRPRTTAFNPSELNGDVVAIAVG